jgi:Cof subfamily protein (haloacid dehalogenase superfamily)
MRKSAPLHSAIRLLLADVDGTLLTSARTLAPSTIQAARALREREVALAVTSSRPPRGLRSFIEALQIDTPTGAFNGGAFVRPDLAVIAQTVLSAEVVTSAIGSLKGKGVDVWVYSGDQWYVSDSEGAHVEREESTVRFSPNVLDSFDGIADQVVKIVGVSDDTALMAEAEQAVRDRFTGVLSISRSQTYYLDLTHPDANKGEALTWLSSFLSIPAGQIAAIGDGPNDILMFRRSGLSIAMGNAGAEVKVEADVITSSNDEDGFARAVDGHILSKSYQGAG